VERCGGGEGDGVVSWTVVPVLAVVPLLAKDARSGAPLCSSMLASTVPLGGGLAFRFGNVGIARGKKRWSE
jgi:hypothetical protein